MPVPIICLDDEWCHFMEGYRPLMSKPQYQHFVIVLLGLMRMSRYGARWWDCWSKWQSARACRVEAEHERQCRTQPKRRGRPKQPLVTGYLIGDDSTMHKPTGSRSGLRPGAAICPVAAHTRLLSTSTPGLPRWKTANFPNCSPLRLRSRKIKLPGSPLMIPSEIVLLVQGAQVVDLAGVVEVMLDHHRDDPARLLQFTPVRHPRTK